MSILPSHIVGTGKEFIRWAKTAYPGEFCNYHAGELGVDREHNPHINILADTVLLLAETGFVRLSQIRTYLNTVDVWSYHATRTNGGYAPSAILDGKLTSFEWRALRAVRDRDADMSAARAIRDALAFVMPPSDGTATAILDNLKARKFVQEAPGKGWELSKVGLGVLS